MALQQRVLACFASMGHALPPVSLLFLLALASLVRWAVELRKLLVRAARRRRATR